MRHKKLFTKHYHMVIPALLLLFLIVGITITVNETKQIQNLNSNAAPTNCTVTAQQLTIKKQEQQLLNTINQYRTQQGIGPLTMNSVLKQSSEWQSLDMRTHNRLSHTDSEGRTPDIRLNDCGYDITGGYGENIAEGSNDPNAVFNAWKNDPPHNQILLNSNYTLTGISEETNSTGVAFWTMDFGSGSFTASPLPSEVASPSISNSPSILLSPPISSNPSISQSPFFPTPTTGPVTADMQILVSVKINGIGLGGNGNPKHRTRHVTANVFDASNQLAASGNGFLNYDGSNYFTGTIHLGKLSQGPYFIALVSDYTLQVLVKPEFQNLKINQINKIPPVTLYQGDMNADNVLDINDYNLVLPCFQSIPVCANVNLIDFNDDGVTNVKDYNLFLNSFEVLQGN